MNKLSKSSQVSAQRWWVVAITKPKPVLPALRWMMQNKSFRTFGFLDHLICEDTNCREMVKAGAMEIVSGLVTNASQVVFLAVLLFL